MWFFRFNSFQKCTVFISVHAVVICALFCVKISNQKPIIIGVIESIWNWDLIKKKNPCVCEYRVQVILIRTIVFVCTQENNLSKLNNNWKCVCYWDDSCWHWEKIMINNIPIQHSKIDDSTTNFDRKFVFFSLFLWADTFYCSCLISHCVQVHSTITANEKKNRRIFILIAFHLQKQSQHHRLKEMKETQQQYRLIRVHRPHQMMRKERQAIQLATQRAIGKSHLVHQVIQFYCHLLFDWQSPIHFFFSWRIGFEQTCSYESFCWANDDWF